MFTEIQTSALRRLQTTPIGVRKGTLPFRHYGPLGFMAGDQNLFRFVANSPTSATDSTGLEEYFKDQVPQQLEDRTVKGKLVPGQKSQWKNDPKSFKDQLVLCPEKADIVATLKSIGIKQGQMFKYVVTKSGKLVFLRENIEHPFGPAMEKGCDVGDEVQAAGHARYYGPQGIIFDLTTNHYKITSESAKRQQAAQDQAKKAFASVGLEGARWEADNRGGVAPFLETAPKRK